MSGNAGNENKNAAPKNEKGKGKGKGKKDLDAPPELSPEDQLLKEKLAAFVLTITSTQNQDQNRKKALEGLGDEIRNSTSSMTAVPKPLKFLKEHYNSLAAIADRADAEPILVDILSVLSMTAGTDKRDTLRYRLRNPGGDLGSWGHEYVKHLSGEVGEEWQARETESQSTADLVHLVEMIVPYHMSHHGEPEACDLLMEVEMLPLLGKYVESSNCGRVTAYLSQCARYAPESEDAAILNSIYSINLALGNHPEALQAALRLNSVELAQGCLSACADPAGKKQLALMMGRQKFKVPCDDAELVAIMNNSRLSEFYGLLGKDLGVLDPKGPEDIYKSHLTDTRPGAAASDSARANLASTYVSALVNLGFGTDKLMTDSNAKWLYKNKDHGMTAAVASVGMLHLWDVDNGLPAIDKYCYSDDQNVKAGAMLGIGLITCGVGDEDVDPAFALLSEHIGTDTAIHRFGVVTGLGLAYAGTARKDVAELLGPLVHGGLGIESASLAALALGMVYVGTADADVAETIITRLMECGPQFESISRMLALALGLVFLGRQDAVEPALDAVAVLPEPLQAYCRVTAETCAYAGTGNVLIVQRMLSLAGEKAPEDPEEVAAREAAVAAGNPPPAPSAEAERRRAQAQLHQMAAVVGIAIVAMGEEIGADMCLRTFDHLLQYGEPGVRRAVPLALGLVAVSNPRLDVADVLSKLSHDPDEGVSQGAVLSLGLISAGTNNSRIAASLRQLSTFYSKDPDTMFMVRLAQGLLHLGKGTVTLSPLHSDKTLLSRVGLGGLLVLIHSAIDSKSVLLGQFHYLSYYIACAAMPRMLITVDENLAPLSTTVRVGNAVDTVALAGKPARITGFQTHTTPVLIGAEERAELATDEYFALSPILEGIVILRKNPDWVPPQLTGKDDKKK